MARRSRGDYVNRRKAGEGASDPKLLEADGNEGGSDIGRWAKEEATPRSWPPTGADAGAASSSGPSTCWCRAPPHPTPAPARATSASSPCTRRCRLPVRPAHPPLQAIDSTSLAYIRHLVESLERLNFDNACMHQLNDDASDLFSPRVPDDIGSRTLVAYQREDIRERRAIQEEKVRATMAKQSYVDGLVE
uniref:Uncharacterized protein n=1 Tax=Oryza barthii TaxID=65489 RepID=A0A0D3HTV7_9ORYZ